MKDIVTVRLPKYAFYQILDGLYWRLEVWRYTEEYLETGYVHEPYEVEACSGPEEAKEIGDFYEEIIREINTQLTLQGQ